MSLDSSFRDLRVSVQELHEAVSELRMTAVEDRPLRDEVALVDTLGDRVEDIGGWTAELLDQVARGEAALGGAEGPDMARRALGACREPLLKFLDRYLYSLASYERMAEVMDLGRHRGGEWLAWTRGIKEALDRCLPLVLVTADALLGASLELAGRGGGTSISITSMTGDLPVTASARKGGAPGREARGLREEKAVCGHKAGPPDAATQGGGRSGKSEN